MILKRDSGGRPKRSVAATAGIYMLAGLSCLSSTSLPSGMRKALADESITASSRVPLELRSQTRKDLVKTSLLLAKLGFKSQAEEVFSLFLEAEPSKSYQKQARKKLDKELKEASEGKLSEQSANRLLKKSRKMIASLASAIMKDANNREISYKQQAARIALALDSTNKTAGITLGYTKRQGDWISPEEVKSFQARDAILDLISGARGLDFSDQIEVGKAEHEVFKSICSRPASFAKYKDPAGGSLEIWSCDMSPDELREICQESLRSLAYANKLLSGEYATRLQSNSKNLFFASKEERARAEALAQKSGNLKFSTKNSHSDNRGYKVFYRKPGKFVEAVMWYAGSDMLSRNYGTAYSQIFEGIFNDMSLYSVGGSVLGFTSLAKGGSASTSDPNYSVDVELE